MTEGLGYKCCRIVDIDGEQRFASALAPLMTVGLFYEIGVRADAVDGPLLLFNRRAAALAFARDLTGADDFKGDPIITLKCRYALWNTGMAYIVLATHFIWSAQTVRRFWHTGTHLSEYTVSGSHMPFTYTYPPHGTVLAAWVEPIEVAALSTGG